MPKKNNPGCGCCGCTCRNCTTGRGPAEIDVTINTTVADNICVSCSDFQATYTLTCKGEIFSGATFLFCQWELLNISKCGGTFDLLLKLTGTSWELEVFDQANGTEATFNLTFTGPYDCSLSSPVTLNHLGGIQQACLWGGSSVDIQAA